MLVENNNITSGGEHSPLRASLHGLTEAAAACCAQTDDCVAIKSGRDADAWQIGQPTRNVIVRNNLCNGPGNGICVGSEMAGGVSNVIVTNTTMVGGGSAIYFKSNLDRGAWIRDVVVDGFDAGHVKQCVAFDNNYHVRAPTPRRASHCAS